ncbi:MAG TPA: metallopeptidase TldD-related protein, partial [Mycobacteriales bacterium]|nr:metallopeptidase TldD-related protein [Mycobacteriales bacterium]
MNANARPQELVEHALQASKADDCIVLVTAHHSVNMRWANNTLTTNGTTRSHEATIISIVNGPDGAQAASMSRSGVTLDDIAELAQQSAAAAADSPAADDAAPLVRDRTANDWAEAPAETSVGDFGGVTDGLAAAFEAAGRASEGRYGYAEHSVGTVYLGSSTGVRLRHVQPAARVELTGRSADGSRSAWAGMSTGSIRDVDVTALEQDVARRLEWSKRKVDLEAGHYDTVLPPTAVADLLIYMYWSMGAQDADEGQSVFSKPGGGTRIGESLSPSKLTLRSDPAMPGQECEPFVAAAASSRSSSVFDNGLELSATEWISDGTLSALTTTRHSAHVTGLPITPGIDNLELVTADGSGDVASLVAGVERGLLLTCLWYIREVDPQSLLLTGLTRDGVFLVEN